jgi:hypothetical protein
LFYRAGYPVYRKLTGLDGDWELQGEQQDSVLDEAAIRVFPGFVYRRVEPVSEG